MRLIILALIGAMAGSLAACGGGSSGNADAPSTAQMNSSTPSSTGNGAAPSGSGSATSGATGSTTGSSTSGSTGTTGGTGASGSTGTAGGTGSTGSTGGTGSTGSTGGTGTSGGTGSGAGTAPNEVAAVVDCGPTANCATDASNDVLYVSVTICEPGTTTCATIDHVMVDTGSEGLRILSSALAATPLALTTETDASGDMIAECTQFAQGYTFGEIVTADVELGSEKASSVPVQIIGDAQNSPSYPSDCKNPPAGAGGTNLYTVNALQANGVLGIGFFNQDCGSSTSCTGAAGTVVQSLYYTCAKGVACQDAASGTVSAAQQLTNPVTMFATDNNGVIITLPAVPDAGAASVTGSLIFGIDTESNNASSTMSTVLFADPTAGTITTTYDSATLADSFFDTGANAYFFSDSTLTPCTKDTGYYCPTTEQPLTATVASSPNSKSSAGKTPATIQFNASSAEGLNQANPTFVAFDNLSGTLLGRAVTDSKGVFIWGLPFFFGKSVYFAYSGATTTAGGGPYYGY